jgi:hypothetical protein
MQRLIANLHGQGDPAFSLGYEYGKAMALEKAIAFALGEE